MNNTLRWCSEFMQVCFGEKVEIMNQEYFFLIHASVPQADIFTCWLHSQVIYFFNAFLQMFLVHFQGVRLVRLKTERFTRIQLTAKFLSTDSDTE